MDGSAAVGHQLSEIVTIEQRRAQCVREGDSRLAKAEKRTATAEARIAEWRREHDDACAQETARLNREIAKVRASTERMLSENRAREQATWERRAAVEAETQQLLVEIDTIKASSEGLRSKLEQEISTVDQRMEETLCSTHIDVASLSACVENDVHGMLGSLSAENARVWSLEDHAKMARDLTGAKTLDAPDPLPARAVLPFGSTQNPFDGFGTYGSKPPQRAPKGFREETTRRILDAKVSRSRGD